MEILIQGKKRKVKNSVLSEIMNEINVNPEEFLVVRDNELITSDTKINNGDSLELLSIVSGG